MEKMENEDDGWGGGPWGFLAVKSLSGLILLIKVHFLPVKLTR